MPRYIVKHEAVLEINAGDHRPLLLAAALPLLLLK